LVLGAFLNSAHITTETKSVESATGLEKANDRLQRIYAAESLEENRKRMTNLYTMDEAAGRLRISRRFLQEFLAKHPADPTGVPYYVPMGNTKPFTDRDLDRIIAATREEERWRLNLSRRVRASRRTTTVAAPISDNLLTAAHELIGPRLQKELSRNGNARSNVVALPSQLGRRS
jgi:hypothetical protein